MKRHTPHNATRPGWKSALLIAAALVLFGTAPARAQRLESEFLSKSKVVRPNDNYRGKSYAQWSAEWWQWDMELPVQDANGNPLPHPSVDDPRFDVTEGQEGSVWFLAAPFGTVERTCTIPRNKALFVAILNAEASDLEGLGATREEQRDTAKFLADHIVPATLFCTIDGSPVNHLERYRVLSPQFHFTAPTPWVFGPTGGAGTSVGDGYHVLIEPLSTIAIACMKSP